MATSILARCFGAVLLCALSCSTGAQTIGIHLFSAHQSGGYNNFDPGVYVRLGSGWTGGIYRNSCGRISAYAGFTWERSGSPSLALTVGAVTGYPSAAVSPLLVPSLALPLNEATNVRLALVPKPPTGTHSSSALHLMLERRFN